MMVDLELGCNEREHPEAIGVDTNPNIDGVDVVQRMGDVFYLPNSSGQIIRYSTGFPFRTDTFDRVFVTDYLEHVQVPLLFKEIHRVSKPDAVVDAKFPHYSNPSIYSDPTHTEGFEIRTPDTPPYIQRFGIRALDHFCRNTEFGQFSKQYTQPWNGDSSPFPFELEERRVDFIGRRAGMVGKFIDKRIGTDRYERYCSSIIPIGWVYTRLRVVKE